MGPEANRNRENLSSNSTMIWCPYTDRELELNETTPEHIIALALGGCNQLVIPVHGPTNATLGSEIDGKLTKDFIVKFLRREADARGHNKKKPQVIFKKATFQGRPAQVEFLGGKNLPLIWDARSASYVDSAIIPGETVGINFAWDRLIMFRLAAKVALSAGYFALGDYWRNHVDHGQARLIMNAGTLDEARKIKPQLKALVHDLYTDLPDDQKWFADVLRLCCALIKGSIIMIIPGPENVGVVVGILGQYFGMVNLPADTSQFPLLDPAYDLGHCLVVSDRKLARCSFRELLWLILNAAAQQPDATGIDPNQLREQAEKLKELGVVLPEYRTGSGQAET
jgi:hypothetical protein